MFRKAISKGRLLSATTRKRETTHFGAQVVQKGPDRKAIFKDFHFL